MTSNELLALKIKLRQGWSPVIDWEITNDCAPHVWEDHLDDIRNLGVVEKKWRVDAEDVGWQNLSAYMKFYAPTAQSFLSDVVGFYQTTWRLRLLASRYVPATLYGIVTHHDSPMGEYRRITRRY